MKHELEPSFPALTSEKIDVVYSHRNTYYYISKVLASLQYIMLMSLMEYCLFALVKAIFYFGVYFQFVLKCYLYYLQWFFSSLFYFLFLTEFTVYFQITPDPNSLFCFWQNSYIYWIAFCFVEFLSMNVSPMASFGGKTLNYFFRAFRLNLWHVPTINPRNKLSILINSLYPPVYIFMAVTSWNADTQVPSGLKRNDFPRSIINFKNWDFIHLRLENSVDNLNVASC